MKFDIKIPIYKCTCHIVIDKEIEKVINKYVKNKKWEKHLAVEAGNELHGLAINPRDNDNFYIFYSSGSLTVNYIAHEISHMIDFIMDEKGIEDKGEARAYLTGYVSEKIFDYIFKKQILINKWWNKPEIQKPKEDEKSD